MLLTETILAQNYFNHPDLNPPIIKKKTIIKAFVKKKESNFTILENEEGLNEKLLKFKEFKYLSIKTNIQPKYFAYLIVFLLGVMIINYLENLLTLLIGMLYPIYYSIKALRERNRKKIIHWLQYWIIFSLFLNLECMFAYFLTDIPMYFFYKIVFLLIMFLPQYNGAKYFYENFIIILFRKYEGDVMDMSASLVQKIRRSLFDTDIDREENLGDKLEDHLEDH